MSRQAEQLDNSTFRLKAKLRVNALRELSGAEVVAIEAYGGSGRLFRRCYGEVERGAVFDTDPAKAELLARQRPTWAVYEADCVSAIAGGVGGHLAGINLVDVDAYGSAWEAIEAVFSADLQFADKVVLVVNDGCRKGCRYGTAWRFACMKDAVAHFGNAAIYDEYLDVCRWLVARHVGKAGYSIKRWTAYTTGKDYGLAHIACVLQR